MRVPAVCFLCLGWLALCAGAAASSAAARKLLGGAAFADNVSFCLRDAPAQSM
jgi:hypothetical protein